ncbi:RING-H2 finger protein ATL20-like [Rhodamnia argentea]|uniref:RING-type E3 ubiquitin transferase n=1 Tax=Rhodamnia argentea TaxID=178133 RepID=A0ABM3HXT4_9MYRT|nr:RING-H2 finger protein ATL20-like [Rhodamnia argentea]
MSSTTPLPMSLLLEASIFLAAFSVLHHPLAAEVFETCAAGCGSGPDMLVARFPFWLRGDGGFDTGCGLTGFALTCDQNRSQLILDLPRSGKFAVRHINYTDQTISINDPSNCLAKRLFDGFDVSGSPFAAVMYSNFTFLNCTSRHVIWHVPTTCMSRVTNGIAVLATISQDFVEETTKSLLWCRRISNVLVPLQESSTGSGQVDALQASDLTGDILLTWQLPTCKSCEVRGGRCGYDIGSGSGWGPDRKIGCCDLPSRPRGAKFGTIIGVGVPGLLCIVVLTIFTFKRARAQGRAQLPNNTDLPYLIRPQSATVSMGLDGPTIESYPVTWLGESGRLPKPNDTTCPICLHEYGPKETLRSIPNYNHYFHVNCIYEWLRLNATCPVCRKSLNNS